MVTPQDLSTDSQVRTSLRDSFFYPGSERVKGKINLKKKSDPSTSLPRRNKEFIPGG